MKSFKTNKMPRTDLMNTDFHIHTNWTDGENTVLAMHDAAIELGLLEILFSEHVRHSSYDWYEKFANEVRSLPSNQCQAWVGMEAKITNFEGEIDATSEMISLCDYVMASVHRFPGEEGVFSKNSGKFETMTHYDDPVDVEYQLSCAALENPNVDILGHPFGMSYKRFGLAPSQAQIEDVVKKAARYGVAFEVNVRYHPNVYELIELCRQHNAIISFGSNSHSVSELKKIHSQLKNGVRNVIA